MDNDWGGGKANRLVFAIFDEECERLEVFLFGHRLSHLAPLMIAFKQTPLGFSIDWFVSGEARETGSIFGRGEIKCAGPKGNRCRKGQQ
jgi:hypothetical protein